MQHPLAVRGGSQVQVENSDVNADDSLGEAHRRSSALDFDSEGDRPLTRALGHRGGHDPTRASFEVTVELAGRLIGFELANPTDANVVRICEAHSGTLEAN